MRKIIVSALASAALVLAGLGVSPALAGTGRPDSHGGGHGGGSGVALPSSMAATGDSITRAFDANGSCFLSDCPAYSWSTGTATAVDSQYLRLLAANRKINGHAYNDAATGATMAELDGQLSQAAGQGAQYVTVLMGANDLCTSSVSTMTPTATFQAEFQQAMTDFAAADPGAKVFVSSIPNIYQLWSLLHANLTAEAIWTTFGVCQSMLSTSDTDADRAAVAAQESADNNALAAVCAEFAQCRWDGLATYNTTFTTSDISTIDYFHPSSTGQAKLAAVTWGASYWPSTK